MKFSIEIHSFNNFRKWLMCSLHKLILFSLYFQKKIIPGPFWILISAFFFMATKVLILYSTMKSTF